MPPLDQQSDLLDYSWIGKEDDQEDQDDGLLDYSWIGKEQEPEPEDPRSQDSSQVLFKQPQEAYTAGDNYSNVERVGERFALTNAKAITALGAMAANQKAEVPEWSFFGNENKYPIWSVQGALLYLQDVADYTGSLAVKSLVDIADLATEDDVRETLREANRIVSDEANKALGSKELQYTGNGIQKYGYEVAEGVVNMAPAIAAGWATRNPGVSLGLIGAQVAGNSYSDYMEKTGDHDRAMAAAKFNVLAEVIPETIPVMAFLKKAKAGDAVARFIEGSLGEAGQEALTEILQSSYDAVQLENMTLSEALRNIDWGQVGHAALLGFGVGTVLSTPGTFGDVLASREERRQQRADQQQDPDSHRATFTPTHNALGGQPVQQATKNGEPIPGVFVTRDGQTVRDPNAVQIAEVDPEFDVDAQAARIQNEVSGGIVGSQMEQSQAIPFDEIDMEGGVTPPEIEVTEYPFDEQIDILPGAEVEDIQVAEEIDISDTRNRGPFSSYSMATAYQKQQKADDLAPIQRADGKWELTDKKSQADLQRMRRKNQESQPGIVARNMDTVTEEEVSQVTEEIEPTGEAIRTSEELRTNNPQFENTIFSFKPGDKRGKLTVGHYYGEILGTEGADGDPVDVILNKDYDGSTETPGTMKVFVIDQKDSEPGKNKGAFRQHKVLAGFDSKEAARKGYLEMWDRAESIGDIQEMTLDEFQEWKQNGDHKSPIGDESKYGTETPAAAQEGSKIASLREKYKAGEENADLDAMSSAISEVKTVFSDHVKTETDAGRMPVIKDGRLYKAVHPSTRNPGQYQVTVYNDTGALSDSQHKTLDQAIDEVSSIHSDIVDPSKADELMSRLSDAEGKYQESKQAVSRETTKKKKLGKRRQVQTSSGETLDTRYTLVEADELVTSNDDAGNVNKAYPAELQPRDRSRTASQAQVNKIARNINPELLGDSPKASDGAPIIGRDNIVESGNARTMALRKAYQENGAEGYRQYLRDNAAAFGLTEADIDGMKSPVLVRERTDDADIATRAEFARQANQPDVAPLAPAEQAKSDAARISDADMALYEPSDDGNVLAASNDSFLQTFAKSLGDLAAGGMSTADGRWTKQMADRVQAAIFWKAYQDERLLTLLAEEADPDIKNIINALNKAAPAFARARAARNEFGDLDVVADIVSAIDLLRQAKADGTTIEQLASQMGFFGNVDPLIANLAGFLEANTRSAKRIGIGFSEMARFLESELKTLEQDSLFDMPPATKDDIVAAAAEKIKREYGDDQKIQDIFSQGQVRSEGGERDAQPGTPGREQEQGSGAEAESSQEKVTGEKAAKQFEADYFNFTQLHPLDDRARIHMNQELKSPDDFAILEISRVGKDIAINSIQSSRDGKGNGSEGLNLLTDIADKNGVNLYLTAMPYGKETLSQKQLVAWYKRHGFEVLHGDRMKRTPKKPATSADITPTAPTGPKAATKENIAEIEAQGKSYVPQRTVKAYKLFTTKRGEPDVLYPLFVDADTAVPIGQWVNAKQGETKNGKVKSKIGHLANRPGWHSSDAPTAPQIGRKDQGEKKPNWRPGRQIWAEVEIPADIDWQTEANDRAERKADGGILQRTSHITDQVPAGGYYNYKTNPNQPGEWMISGAIKVNRLLTDAEVAQINEEKGHKDLPRKLDDEGNIIFKKETQDDLFDKSDAQVNQELIEQAKREKDAKRDGQGRDVDAAQSADDLFANDGQLPPDLFSFKKEMYDTLDGKEISYEVFLEEEQRTVNVTEDAGTAMRRVDARLAELEKLRACI